MTQKNPENSDPPATETKPNEDSDLVLTPGGFRPRSQVHQVPPGHHVSGEGGRLKVVETDTGKVLRDLGEVSTTRHSKAEVSTSAEAPMADSGWIANTGWLNTSGRPISYFSTKWVVPPPPETADGQLLYLFNGLEQGGSGAAPFGPYILQPVLQWGLSPDGGGSVWAVANWYVNGPNGAALQSTLVPVNPGDVLQGVMALTGQSESGFSYTSEFAGLPAANLAVTDVAELTWACETLECYGLTQCSDYPNTPMTAFYDIEIRLGGGSSGGTEATLNWQVRTYFTDCGQDCVVISNDSPGGVINFYYHKPLLS
jgi:hypothetical protein